MHSAASTAKPAAFQKPTKKAMLFPIRLLLLANEDRVKGNPGHLPNMRRRSANHPEEWHCVWDMAEKNPAALAVGPKQFAIPACCETRLSAEATR